jgi:hypothetical protein
MGVCCRIQLCCPPDKAARALAEHLADGEPESQDGPSYTDVSARVLGEFTLVPRDLKPTTDAPEPHLGEVALIRLHSHIRNELLVILCALGHKTESAA